MLRITDKRKAAQFIKAMKKRHFDITQVETLPDAGKQFEKLKREVATLKKRVSTLEAQVNIAFAKAITGGKDNGR